MFAITQDKPGGPKTLRWEKAPDPTPGPNEVIIDIAASAVNRADLLQREGKSPPPPGASDIIGLECSGTIASVGAALTLDRIGERVTALLSGGGYATRVAVPIGQVMSVPEGVDIVTAGALPEGACTVWSNLVHVAALREGEVLLIHGGGSGIGTMGIQIARVLGAKVAVTAGSQRKLDACAELGADILINYNDVDFVEAIGMQGGVATELDLSQMTAKNVGLFGTSLRRRPESEKATICREVEKYVWSWVGNGEVRPVVDRVMAMPEAGAAHTLLDSGDVIGKIVLETP